MQLDRSTLLEAYRLMRTIRAFEERMNIEFANGNIPGMLHLSTGQEAVAAGVCMNLRVSDYIASTHRGHGHSIAKGCDVGGMVLEIFAKAGGLCAGKGGSMHIADFDRGMLGANAIVGGAPPLAIGGALSAKVKGEDTVSVAFAGDGAANQGTTFEAMNMAVVLQLPAIFVFENNGFGEGMTADFAVGSKDIAGRARGFGMPSVAVDGTDFFAVHSAMGEAVDRARTGGGPSVIEARCVRFHGHFVGDPQRYRTREEMADTRETKDPLRIFWAKVVEAGLLEKSQIEQLDAEAEALVEDAVQAALDAPAPPPEALHTDVYTAY